MDKDLEQLLIKRAREARKKAFTPFSHFKVGAALLCKGGKVYLGCNIENPSLSLSICAERVALIKAISEGEKVFDALAIIADTHDITYPCGACRQMIWEFGPKLRLILTNLKGDIRRTAIRDLLPEPFDFQPCQNEYDKEGISHKNHN